MKATISMSRNSLWKMIQAMSPCQYSVEELEHRLGESVQSYSKGDCCTSDELRKRHPVCE